MMVISRQFLGHYHLVLIVTSKGLLSGVITDGDKGKTG